MAPRWILTNSFDSGFSAGLMRKDVRLAPAICAGNAVVLKPSELTPLTSLALGILCDRAEGVPRGLVSVLAGAGPTTGGAAVSHPDTRLVVFVGSVEAGAQIAAVAAPTWPPPSAASAARASAAPPGARR